MNKKEFIKNIAKKTNLTNKDCLSCVNAITELISDVLKRGEQVYISGFGKFDTQIKPEREFYNPRTAQKDISYCKIVPIFRSGKKLKENMYN